jgi:hypothetical protein
LKFELFFHPRRVAATNVVTTNDHLLLTLDRVGRGAALDVDGAVGEERNARGGGDRPQLDLQLRHFLGGLDRVDDPHAEIHRVADRLLLVVEVRKRHRDVAMTDGEGARGSDLLQCVELLPARGHDRGQHRQRAGEPDALPRCLHGLSLRE